MKSKIPALEEIYANPTDGIIINSSYDDEGAVADFTNLEPVVNVSPIPTSRINSIHPSTLYLEIHKQQFTKKQNSDYAGANLDKKSTTGGCPILARDYILAIQKATIWLLLTSKRQNIILPAHCYGQNLVYHSKTKHIPIRHHFVRDAYEKKLIQVLKIHTDDNVADLLTKAFDVSSYLSFRESLGRAIDGTEAMLLPKLFILWLAIVNTDSAKLVPLGKDSTAIETLKKIPPRV
ncbi:hypothetical protein Tco_0788190 [Tanacetum coccineum]